MDIGTADHESVGALDAALKRCWLKRLLKDHEEFNHDYLKGALRPPGFALSDDRSRLGYWEGESQTIFISEWHIRTHLWENVRATLRHEMAHQYVAQVLKPADETAHGPAFRRACHLLRCDPRAGATAETLTALDSSTNEADRIVTKVRKLMALGGSPNEHEASSAMRMASRLLLKYNVDLSSADRVLHYQSLCLGRPRSRTEEYLYILARILRDHFFVRTIFLYSYDAATNRSGKILEISGTAVNLEIAEYVHAYLTETLEFLWTTYRNGAPDRGTGRFQFYSGLMAGFFHKLTEQTREVTHSRELVWVGDRHLDDYWTYRHPRTQTIRVGGVSRGSEYHDGVEQGRQISLHRAVRDQAAPGETLLLPQRDSGR